MFSARKEAMNYSWLLSFLDLQILLCKGSTLLSFMNISFLIFFHVQFCFNWRIIALQNFVVFCQTSTWISHRCKYVPSLLTFKNISKCFPIKLLWFQKSLPNILVSITSSWIYFPYHWQWTSKNGFFICCRKDFKVLYPHSPWKLNCSMQNVFKVILSTII